MHQSRVNPVPEGQRYIASTAVFMAEVIKLAVSITGEFYSLQKANPSMPPHHLFRPLFRSIFSAESWKLMVPAILYTLQTSLLYVATSNLDAATFQVTYQLKILTTVLFSVMMLGRKLSSRQWLSLLLLTVGIAIVQLPDSFSWVDVKSVIYSTPLEARAAPEPRKPLMNASKGLAAVVAASLTSGLVGVYLEKVVKDSLDSVSLMTRNAQLSFYSLFPAFFIGVMTDSRQITKSGFFVGYSGLVWSTILLQAFGGFMVAVCITYTDNIAKNFATSISIVLSTLAGAIIFHYIPTNAFLVGSSIVMAALYLYSGRRTSATTLPQHNQNRRDKAPLLNVYVRDLGSDPESGISDDEYSSVEMFSRKV